MTIVTKYPQSNSVVSNSGWTNPTSAYADDGTYATLTSADPIYSRSSKFYNFGFDIPSGSTINSVAVQLQYKINFTTGSTNYIKTSIYKGGSLNNESSDYAEPTTDTTYSVSATGTWTPSDLNNNAESGFSVNIFGNLTYTSRTWSLDFVRVVVDYTPPATAARRFAQFI